MASITYTRGRIDNIDIDPDTSDYYFTPLLNFVSGWVGTVSLFHNTDGHDVNYAYKYWETVVVGTDPDGNAITTRVQKTIDPPILNSLGFNQISAPDDLRDPFTVVGPPNSPALRYIELDRQVQFLQYNYTVNRLLDPLDFFSPDGTVFDSYQAMEDSIVEAYQDYLNELSQHLLGFVATVNNVKTSNSNAEIVFDGFDLSFVIADGSFSVPYLYAGGSFILYPMEASLELKNPENFLEVDELISEADEDDTVVILSGATSDFDPEVASNITKVSLAGGDDLAVVFSSKDTFEFDGGAGSDVFALKSESNGPFTITLHDNEFVYVDEITSASSATFHNDNSEFSTVFDLGDNVVALNRRATYDLTGTSSRFFGSNREETIDGTDQADALFGDGHPFGDDFDETQIIENIGELGDFTQFSLNDTDQITYLLSLLNNAGSQLVAGQDRLVGDGGDDLLVASPRMRAILEAGDGNDLVIGGSNNDEIDVGKDNDKAFGGEGEDTFKAAAGSNMLFGYSPDYTLLATYVPTGEETDEWRYNDPFNDIFEATFQTEHATNGTISEFWGGESSERGSDRDVVLIKGRPTDYTIFDPTIDGLPTAVVEGPLNGVVSGNGFLLNLYDVEYAQFEDLPISDVVETPDPDGKASLLIDATKHASYAYLPTSVDVAETKNWWPLHSIELGIDPFGTFSGFDYSFIDGVYKADSLLNSAVAHVYFGQYSGSDTLVLDFRGTDEQPLDFIDFPDFNAHFQKFTPLLEAIDKYLTDNNTVDVVVAGHSLGAAMVQMFLNQYPDDARFKGFAIASPGVNINTDDDRITTVGHSQDLVFHAPFLGGNVLLQIPSAAALISSANLLWRALTEETSITGVEHSGGDKYRVALDGSTWGVGAEHSSINYVATSTRLAANMDRINAVLAASGRKEPEYKNLIIGHDTSEDIIHESQYFSNLFGFLDEIYIAGDGDDRITPGLGNDIVDGGLGLDTAELDYDFFLDLDRDLIKRPNVVVKVSSSSVGTKVEISNTTEWGFLKSTQTDVFLHVEQFRFKDTFTPLAPEELVSFSASNLEATEGHGHGLSLTELLGTEDTDFVYATSAVSYNGLGGSDIIGGSDEDDVLMGGGGNDSITGNGGDDIVDGGAGDDVLIGGDGSGDDQYDGGEGTDLLVYSSATDPVTVDLETGQASGNDIDTDTITGVENVLGGSGNDTISGNAENNQLSGGPGDDTLDGRAGSDILIGNEGNDTLTGGADADIFAFTTGHGMDRIEDFELGTDQLFYLGNAVSVADIDLEQQGNDLIIKFDPADLNSQVVLVGIDGADFVAEGDDAVAFEPLTLPLRDDIYTTGQDQLLVVSAENGVLANDGVGPSEIDTLTVIDLPENGSLAFNTDGSFTYTPDPGFAGNDSFFYRVTSPFGGASSAAVVLAVGNSAVTDIELSSGGLINEDTIGGTTVAEFSVDGPDDSQLILVGDAEGLFFLDGTELRLSDDADLANRASDNLPIVLAASPPDGTAYIEQFDLQILQSGGPIVGTPFDDSLGGTTGNDTVQALAGDDLIDGSAGSDSINGGPGNDAVVYDGERADYTQTLNGNGTITVEKPGGGTDTLTDVERIDFTDGDYVYDLTSPNTGFGYRIYQASFGRTPDEGGVRFWIGNLDNFDQQGWSDYEKEQFLASQFIQSDEFRDLYGANPSNFEYIDAMYQNVLFRLPDQAGYDFWVGGMENDGLTREDILIAFTKSDENVNNNAANLDDGVWVV